MTSKIFRSTVFVAAIVLLLSLVCIMGCLYDYVDDMQVTQLLDELHMAAVGTEQVGVEFLKAVNSDHYRLTWVTAEGQVVYDTAADESRMTNHADREEIQEALKTGKGSASRHSDTLLERTIYEAVRLTDGSVLRISVSQKTMLVLVLGMLQPVCVVALCAIVLSLILSHRMSRKIMEPLNALDLDHPLENDTYDELSPLLRRLNQQYLQINHQKRKLQRMTDEFQQVTACMQEGLVVIDKETRIRSINAAACKIFDTDAGCVGRNFYVVHHGNALQKALDAALERGHGNAVIEMQSGAFRFDVSSIQSGGKLLGAVILAVDVTEQQNAERTRREFTANVSHELKTPLQSIIGSAELLESGLVKPEDRPRFMGHIRKEASRLVNLIEDILRLSRLDEDVEIPQENVDLYILAQEVIGSLELQASKKNVTVELSGTSCEIRGVRGMLFEIVRNLCDNAIKYNVDGGAVRITVEPGVLTVSDTGIGIPLEHQSRVFERFYRVDKSHSKQSGGTGLGLSIVKHAVQYHNAKMELESTPGVGTTVKVRF